MQSEKDQGLTETHITQPCQLKLRQFLFEQNKTVASVQEKKKKKNRTPQRVSASMIHKLVLQ